MKPHCLLAWMICVFAFSSVGNSQQKGDVVIVVKDIVLGAGTASEQKLNRGTELSVLDAKGDKILLIDRKDGWVSKSNVDTPGNALDVFTLQIKRNSKDAGAYLARGTMLIRQKQFDASIDDCTRAIRLNSKLPEAYLIRGNGFSSNKEYKKAIADYTEVIRLVPTSVSAFTLRGNCWQNLRQYQKAEADWIEAVRLNPQIDYAYNQLAWMKATCPEEHVRDGKKAVEYATKLCELNDWKNQEDLDTLAAAYAEAGDFEAAVKWQSKVCMLAAEAEKAECQMRLELYQSGKPFHETPAK